VEPRKEEEEEEVTDAITGAFTVPIWSTVVKLGMIITSLERVPFCTL
jgi:hypothetical protein